MSASLATILGDKGLLSGCAFVALVMLALLSAVFTGPAFRSILGPGVERRQSGGQLA